MVLAPDSECRIFDSALGSTVTGMACSAIPPDAGPVDNGGQPAGRAMTPRLILALVRPLLRYQCRFHDCFLAPLSPIAFALRASANPLPRHCLTTVFYTNKEETDVSS